MKFCCIVYYPPDCVCVYFLLYVGNFLPFSSFYGFRRVCIWEHKHCELSCLCFCFTVPIPILHTFCLWHPSYSIVQFCKMTEGRVSITLVLLCSYFTYICYNIVIGTGNGTKKSVLLYVWQMVESAVVWDYPLLFEVSSSILYLFLLVQLCRSCDVKSAHTTLIYVPCGFVLVLGCCFMEYCTSFVV